MSLRFSGTLESLLQQEIQIRSLPEDFMLTVKGWYLPVAKQVYLSASKTQGTFLVSFNGAQGSGKSTITAFLRLILIHHFKLNTVEVSIDDFYMTLQSRLQLASEIHPLLATRGVPGTHDVELALDTIKCLQATSTDSPCLVPQFDKACDDRKPESEWLVVSEPVDVILFEGWCNHAPVQTDQQLQQPINDLERDEDSAGIWRSYVNQQLAVYHQLLFDQAGLLIYLKVPSFEKVFEWRGLQEKKLAQLDGGNKNAIMDVQQLNRFIQHYERITRLCLDDLPDQAGIVLYLNDEHGIDSVRIGDTEIEHV